MPKNMGTADRIVRAAIVAPLLLIVALVVVNSTVIGIVLVAFAGVMLLTAAVGSCPLYVPFGASTCARPTSTSDHAM